MNAIAIPHAIGDWSLRGVDADQVFACQQLSDDAMTAAVRVSARFDPSFPGWQLYRRIVAGVGLFDRQLEAWAVGTARSLARMRKRSGREYIRAANRHPAWIAQAGRDALDFAIYGKYAAGLGERADRFGVSPKTYQAVRDPVAACMIVGLETFAAELRREYYRIFKSSFLDEIGTATVTHEILKVRDACSGYESMAGIGCYIREPSPDPDTL